MRKKTQIKTIKEKRDNKVSVSFTDKEIEAIDRYCKKYKVRARTKVIREAALRFVMDRFLTDYPTLF